MRLILLTALISYSMMSSNVRGLQSSKKKISLIKCFKSKLMHNGVNCLQKKIVLRMKIHGQMILMAHVFPHGVSNSCSVLIAYLGKKSFVLTKPKTDKGGRTMILNITLDSDQFIVIHL